MAENSIDLIVRLINKFSAEAKKIVGGKTFLPTIVFGIVFSCQHFQVIEITRKVFAGSDFE